MLRAGTSLSHLCRAQRPVPWVEVSEVATECIMDQEPITQEILILTQHKDTLEGTR